jgi:hypothetical protein
MGVVCMREREPTGVDLLLNEPEIRAWLEPEREDENAEEDEQ